MTGWFRSNGMWECQAVEKHTMTVFDFYFEDGMLKRLNCHDYQTREIKFDDVYNPLNNQFISEEHFEMAMEIFCNTSNYDDIMNLIEHLENDKKFQSIAKEVICKVAHQAAAKSYYLTRIITELEIKK